MPRRNQFDFDDIESDALLLVEGIDDARFCAALLRHLNKPDVQIAAVRGTANFRPFLSNVLARSDNLTRLRRLGIVRDADASAASSFQSLRDALANANLPAPSSPWQPAQTGNLSVSVAILPDGASPGTMEDLCLRSIADRPESPCIDQYIVCLSAAGVPDRQLGKTRLYAYLAAGNEPGRRLGEAADAGVWDWTAPAFAQVAQFLSSL